MLRVLGPGSLLRPNSLSQAAAPVWLSSWGDDQNARETSPVGVARGSSFIEFPEKKVLVGPGEVQDPEAFREPEEFREDVSKNLQFVVLR